ncbi:MAG: IS1595 family transposase [Rickettsiales bacterium]|nr:IS1595 family transposase [Rickettsiales bacterium]
MSILSAPYFHNEEAAIKHLEGIVWADGVVCPKCGVVDNSSALKGKSTRPGLRKCYSCRKQFTVKVGTVFESSHIPLHKWLQAAFLMASSKKGISSHQLHRTLEVTYKTAWFMTHRLREAMRVLNIEPVGGEGKAVEVDETYIGTKTKKPKGARGYAHKNSVLSLVERGGKVQSYHVQHVTADSLRPILMQQIKQETALMTDEAYVYKKVGKEFASHEYTSHGIGEYVRGDIHTNTIEGYFSIFKRGMKGVYQHCSSDHLKRYLAEFDFRYNERDLSDSERTNIALKGIQGKRLTYQRSGA